MVKFSYLTPQIFEVPPIVSGMGKVTNVKFGRYM